MNTQQRGSQRSPSRARLRTRGFVVLAAVGVALAAAGCGEDDVAGIPVTYVVSEDFGGHLIDRREVTKLGKAPTVIRVLQREFDDVKTAYGGRFVTSIAGRGATTDPPTDWIFYINGRESERGAAGIQLQGGDHVQWDIHRWDASKLMTRTVGAFPRPWAGSAKPVALLCDQEGEACSLARQSLGAANVKFDEGLRSRTRDTIVVGQWRQISGRGGVPDLAAGPDASGVFGSFEGDGIVLRSAGGEPALKFGRGSGLVAAVERAGDGTTWIVTGVDRAGTERAARLLNRETLQNRFAVAADEESVAALPIVQ